MRAAVTSPNFLDSLCGKSGGLCSTSHIPTLLLNRKQWNMGKSEQNTQLNHSVSCCPAVLLLTSSAFAWRWNGQMVNCLCRRREEVLMMLSLFQLALCSKEVWQGNLTWGLGSEGVSWRKKRGGRRKGESLYCTHTFLWVNLSVFGEGRVPPLPAPTRPPLTFTVTKLFFMEAHWKLVFSPNETKQVSLCLFLSLGAGDTHGWRHYVFVLRIHMSHFL